MHYELVSLELQVSNILFSPLGSKAGMKIYLTDKRQIYTYSITSVENVSPDRVDVINDREGVNEVTLVTREDAATSRTIVKGTLEGETYEDAPKEILNAFSKTYNQTQIIKNKRSWAKILVLVKIKKHIRKLKINVLIT